MRVTRIPGDFHDIGDKPCRVYLNEVEIADWIVADDFRRVVETEQGARFGAVRIELAPVICPELPSLETTNPYVEGEEVFVSFRDGDLVVEPMPPKPTQPKRSKKRSR